MAPEGDEGRGVAAISLGEPLAGFDPGISEWVNPSEVVLISYTEYIGIGGEAWEVIHLSTSTKVKKPRLPK